MGVMCLRVALVAFDHGVQEVLSGNERFNRTSDQPGLARYDP